MIQNGFSVNTRGKRLRNEINFYRSQTFFLEWKSSNWFFKEFIGFVIWYACSGFYLVTSESRPNLSENIIAYSIGSLLFQINAVKIMNKRMIHISYVEMATRRINTIENFNIKRFFFLSHVSSSRTFDRFGIVLFYSVVFQVIKAQKQEFWGFCAKEEKKL